MNPNSIFSKFDQALGKTTPTPTNGQPPVTSRADEIRALGKVSTPAPEQPGVASRVGSSLKQTGSDIAKEFTDTSTPAPVRGAQLAATITGAPIKAAYSALPQGVQDTVNKVGEAGFNIINWLGDKLGSTQAAQDFVTKHPDAASFLENTAKTTGALAETAGNLTAVEGGMAGASKLKSVAEEGLAKGNVAADFSQSMAKTTEPSVRLTGPTPSELKIQEAISPKPTVKEAKLAQTQGRLVEGKKPTLFRAGTEDTITPSTKIKSAAQTISDNIPNASKMSEPELYTAIDKNISDTATKLRPKMKATPVTPETIQKINDDWTALKKTQMADAPATEEANVAKRQAKFESLLQKSGSENHAELWDTAIKYDDSIPDGVKKANSLSSESLQLQKDEWLQNRKILSDAMGKSSLPEFKQMSDLYEAKNGLLSKTKVNEAALSKVNQYLKDNPKIAKILGGVTIYEIAKRLGVPLP